MASSSHKRRAKGNGHSDQEKAVLVTNMVIFASLVQKETGEFLSFNLTNIFVPDIQVCRNGNKNRRLGVHQSYPER